VTGLTAKGLDPFGLAMLAIADEGMDVGLGDAEGGAEAVGTSEPRGVDAFGGSPSAFHLTPRSRHPQALALHPTREGRRDDRRGHRLGCGAHIITWEEQGRGTNAVWGRLVEAAGEPWSGLVACSSLR
jgi:hypothetical protein